MKKFKAFAVITLLALCMMNLSACLKSEFGPTENTGKQMTITAQRARKDSFFAVGSLEVGDGEQIVITADLKKGSVRVEILGTSGEQSIDKLPEIDSEAVITANLIATDGASGTVPAGSYLLKATCLEQATGTVRVEVKPAE